jgi:prepilin-type N-terminal cleavage/methylation domain-containing protein
MMLRKSGGDYFPGEKGFTLLEVITVLIILAVIAAYAVSRININVNLPAEVDKFKSNLRYAQQIALSGNQHIWRVAVAANSYTLTSRNLDGSNIVSMNFVSGTSTVNLPSGITSGWTGNINFDQWGSPGNATIVVPLTDGTTTSNITITRNSGFIP